jgi:hypothetical protein
MAITPAPPVKRGPRTPYSPQRSRHRHTSQQSRFRRPVSKTWHQQYGSLNNGDHGSNSARAPPDRQAFAADRPISGGRNSLYLVSSQGNENYTNLRAAIFLTHLRGDSYARKKQLTSSFRIFWIQKWVVWQQMNP